jgi:hypothetical protein
MRSGGFASKTGVWLGSRSRSPERLNAARESSTSSSGRSTKKERRPGYPTRTSSVLPTRRCLVRGATRGCRPFCGCSKKIESDAGNTLPRSATRIRRHCQCANSPSNCAPLNPPAETGRWSAEHARRARHGEEGRAVCPRHGGRGGKGRGPKTPGSIPILPVGLSQACDDRADPSRGAAGDRRASDFAGAAPTRPG